MYDDVVKYIILWIYNQLITARHVSIQLLDYIRCTIYSTKMNKVSHPEKKKWTAPNKFWRQSTKFIHQNSHVYGPHSIK